jgi:type I restriction-modification system DNA methylase subunit
MILFLYDASCGLDSDDELILDLIKDKNYLDAVIGLPANIFYGTSIPTCILVFKKCRENPDNILFIDASNDYDNEFKWISNKSTMGYSRTW